VLFFLAVSSLEIVGLFMGGWGSNNKYAPPVRDAGGQPDHLLRPAVHLRRARSGAPRRLDANVVDRRRPAGALFVAYPVVGQLAFLAFLVATLAAENRVPFDILEAESELVAGFRVEYKRHEVRAHPARRVRRTCSARASSARCSSWAAGSARAAALGPVWFLAKTILIFLVITWVRWSFVRIRVDQILAISWKLLLPATLALLLATGLVGRAARSRWRITAAGPRRGSGKRPGSSWAPSVAR